MIMSIYRSHKTERQLLLTVKKSLKKTQLPVFKFVNFRKIYYTIICGITMYLDNEVKI